MTDTTAEQLRIAQNTSFTVLFAISFCHLLNDMMQALLPAIYPGLKAEFHLSFAQIGVITAVFQGTASLLQPVVGYVSDRRPMPYSLPLGMVSSLAGLLVLAFAGSYAIVLLAAALVGLGSSIFHPESARVARMASGGKHGLAQSLFQTGGNIGSALGPLSAAFVIAMFGQRGVAWYAGVALLGIIVLIKVGAWYKHHGLARIHAAHKALRHEPLPMAQILTIILILALLIFSKYFYLVSISNYFTFYLIQTFHISVPSAQLHLFYFLAAVAVGAFAGGPLGDHFGRKYVIWLSILGPLPFTLILPYANLFWTEVLSVVIGAILASAFPAIVVYAQELLPGKLGMISGVFYGFSFGMGAIGAALLGLLADATSITFVYKVCAFLPLMGLLTAFLPDMKHHE